MYVANSVVHRALVRRAEPRRRGGSGSRSPRAGCRTRCSASTARGTRRAAAAAGSSSAGSTSTRTRCARRRAARPSRRRSRGRSRSYSSAARSPSPRSIAGHFGQGLGELVEEQAAQRARVARVAGEQRALDRLRQVDEREDRPVEVREVRREARLLLLGEAARPGTVTVSTVAEGPQTVLGFPDGNVRVGTSGWSYPSWRPGVLPGRARPVRRSSASTPSASRPSS